MNDYMKALFGPIEELDPYDLGLGIFWGTEGSRDIVNYVWDTRVPQVTDPWPTAEPVTIGDAIAQITFGMDVTTVMPVIVDA